MLIHRIERGAGFTLVELLVAVTLLGIISAAILGVALRQQRFHLATMATIEARRAARDGADVLRGDLRAIAPAAGDLYAIGTSDVELRAAAGTSVVCAVGDTRDVIHLPPRAAANGVLTSWVVPPARGDTVFVRAASLRPDQARWDAHVLTADPAAGGCPTAGGFVATPAESASAIALHIAPPLAPNISPGAALRVVRRVRYELYRAGDGQWYLGYQDCLPSRATPCATVQPVSGPYAPGGVRFGWRDSSGAETSDPTRVRRIDVATVARSGAAIRARGFAPRPAAESLSFTITPRN